MIINSGSQVSASAPQESRLLTCLRWNMIRFVQRAGDLALREGFEMFYGLTWILTRCSFVHNDLCAQNLLHSYSFQCANDLHNLGLDFESLHMIGLYANCCMMLHDCRWLCSMCLRFGFGFDSIATCLSAMQRHPLCQCSTWYTCMQQISCYWIGLMWECEVGSIIMCEIWGKDERMGE